VARTRQVGDKTTPGTRTTVLEACPKRRETYRHSRRHDADHLVLRPTDTHLVTSTAQAAIAWRRARSRRRWAAPATGTPLNAFVAFQDPDGDGHHQTHVDDADPRPALYEAKGRDHPDLRTRNTVRAACDDGEHRRGSACLCWSFLRVRARESPRAPMTARVTY